MCGKHSIISTCAVHTSLLPTYGCTFALRPVLLTCVVCWLQAAGQRREVRRASSDGEAAAAGRLRRLRRLGLMAVLQLGGGTVQLPAALIEASGVTELSGATGVLLATPLYSKGWLWQSQRQRGVKPPGGFLVFQQSTASGCQLRKLRSVGAGVGCCLQSSARNQVWLFVYTVVCSTGTSCQGGARGVGFCVYGKARFDNQDV